MLADGDTVAQSEVSIVSVVIIITDLNDNDPVFTSMFSAVTLSEVSNCMHPVVHYT